MRSSGFSMPTDRRMRAGVMPKRICSSGGMSECVIEAGCEASVSVPPQADDEPDHFEPVEHGEGFRLAALDLEAEGRACALALPLEDRPIGVVLGQEPQVPFRGDRRSPPTLRAPSAAAVILSFRVSSERIRSQPVCGSRIVPRIVRISSPADARVPRPPSSRSAACGSSVAQALGQKSGAANVDDAVGADWPGSRDKARRSDRSRAPDRPPPPSLLPRPPPGIRSRSRRTAAGSSTSR